MQTVTVTDATHRLLAANTQPGKRLVGGQRQPDGSWKIQLDDEVIERLGQLDSNIDKAITIAVQHGWGTA